MTVDTYMFPKTGTTGESPTPAHKFSDFKFQTYAPQAFRKFLNLFHMKKAGLNFAKDAKFMPCPGLTDAGLKEPVGVAAP